MNRVSSLSRLLMLNSAAFLCLVFASVTAAGGVLYLQHQVTKQATELNHMMQTIHVLRGDLYRQLKELFDYVFIGDPDALVEFEDFNRQIEENLQRLEGFRQDEAFAHELETLRQSYESLRGRARAIMSQLDARYSAAELLEVLTNFRTLSHSSGLSSSTSCLYFGSAIADNPVSSCTAMHMRAKWVSHQLRTECIFTW